MGWGGLPDDDRPHYGVSVRYEEDGTAVLTARLPAEQAAIVLAALDTCQEQLELAAAKEQSSAEASPAGGPAARPEEGTESSAEAAEAADVADAAAAACSAAGGSPAWPAGWLPDWLADELVKFSV
jgi:hypothetical protein